MKIKNRLKEIRMKVYMENSKDFACRIGIPLSSYSQIENENRGVTIERAFSIAKRLDLEVSDIWFEE